MSAQGVGKKPFSKFAILTRAASFARINKQKSTTMKKFLAIIVIAGALTACNNSGESTTSSDSTSTMTTDTMNTMNTMPDSLNTAGDTSKTMSDTTHK
jgi:hypothetical protein